MKTSLTLSDREKSQLLKEVLWGNGYLFTMSRDIFVRLNHSRLSLNPGSHSCISNIRSTKIRLATTVERWQFWEFIGQCHEFGTDMRWSGPELFKEMNGNDPLRPIPL